MTYTATKNIATKPNLMSGSVDLTTPTADVEMFKTTLGTTGLLKDNLPTDADGNEYGYLCWQKNTGDVADHGLSDSIRNGWLASNDTTIEETPSPVTEDADLVSWEWLTTKKTPGEMPAGVALTALDDVAATCNITNHGMRYICHYNPVTKFCIVVYEGSGLINHRIPTHLDVKLDFWIHKNLSASAHFYNHFGDGKKRMILNSTSVELSDYEVYPETGYCEIALGSATNAGWNAASNTYVMYGWANSEMTQIGEYIGTGATGNYIDCNGRKPAWLLVKSKDKTYPWYIWDNIRDTSTLNAKTISPDQNIVEDTAATNEITLANTALIINNTDGGANTNGDRHFYITFFDTNKDGGGTFLDLPDSTNTVELTSGYIPYADGYSSNGPISTVEYRNETITGLTLTEGDNWVYKIKDGAYGSTKYQPRIGAVDTWGEASIGDPGKRTTVTHTDYISETGTVSASSIRGSYLEWRGFEKKPSYEGYWTVPGETTGQVEYKLNTPKILKSFRVAHNNTGSTYQVDDFTIEGSNDGENWTTLGTYVSYLTTYPWIANNYNPLEELANSTVYELYRINITGNGGDASYVCFGDLEFNFISPEDYFDTVTNLWYSWDGTPKATPISYLCNVKADIDGVPFEIVPFDKITAFEDLTINGDLTVKGDLDVNNDLTVFGGVNFNGVRSLNETSNTLLDTYEEYTAPSTACTGALTDNIVWKATKVGNLVTLTIPAIYGTTTNVADITFGALLPETFRPITSIDFAYTCAIVNNSRVGAATIRVNATGAIVAYRAVGTGTGWGTSANTGIEYACSFSWVV